MAISLLAAICLWIYVVTVVNPEGTTTISNIPVTFSGAEVLREDQGLVLSGDYQDMVTVSFTGKNSDMKKLEQNKEEISAVVDVSKIRSTRDYTLSYDLLLPDAVPDSAVTITDRTPGNITVHVEKLVKKPVPVKGDFSQVEVADGYMLDSTTFDYDTVTVEGAESVVNQIEYALISMNRTNVDKTISEQLDYTLVDANGEAVSGVKQFELGHFNMPSMEGEGIEAPARTLEVATGFFGAVKKDKEHDAMVVDFLMYFSSAEGQGIYLNAGIENGMAPNGPSLVYDVEIPGEYADLFDGLTFIGNCQKGYGQMMARGAPGDVQNSLREWYDYSQKFLTGQISIDEWASMHKDNIMKYLDDSLAGSKISRADLENPQNEPTGK